MGLKSTWWIADEREPLCDLCNNGGCEECDPDYVPFDYAPTLLVIPAPRLDAGRGGVSDGVAAGGLAFPGRNKKEKR